MGTAPAGRRSAYRRRHDDNCTGRAAGLAGHAEWFGTGLLDRPAWRLTVAEFGPLTTGSWVPTTPANAQGVPGRGCRVRRDDHAPFRRPQVRDRSFRVLPGRPQPPSETIHRHRAEGPVRIPEGADRRQVFALQSRAEDRERRHGEDHQSASPSDLLSADTRGAGRDQPQHRAGRERVRDRDAGVLAPRPYAFPRASR